MVASLEKIWKKMEKFGKNVGFSQETRNIEWRHLVFELKDAEGTIECDLGRNQFICQIYSIGELINMYNIQNSLTKR